MNIDQRIEALTQSVELLSHLHQDNEKRYTAQFGQITESIGRLTGIAETLATIATMHDQRLTDLENGK